MSFCFFAFLVFYSFHCSWQDFCLFGIAFWPNSVVRWLSRSFGFLLLVWRLLTFRLFAFTLIRLTFAFVFHFFVFTPVRFRFARFALARFPRACSFFFVSLVFRANPASCLCPLSCAFRCSFICLFVLLCTTITSALSLPRFLSGKVFTYMFFCFFLSAITLAFVCDHFAQRDNPRPCL